MKKLIIINGRDTDKIVDSMNDKAHMLNHTYYQENYNQVIVLGDKVKGIDLAELGNKLSIISEDANSIDIIVIVHGKIEKNDYYLSLDTPPITGERLLKHITKNINKPVKILFNSCFGANLHKYVSSLKPNSTLITFSDIDKFTDNHDFCSKYVPEYMKLFAEQKLPLEFISVIHCLTQHNLQNSPIISKIYEENMTRTWNFDKFQIDTHNPNLHYFQILNQLLEINKEIKQEHINDVISHINDENYRVDIKQKDNILTLLSEDQINYEEYLKQYYFNITGSLELIKTKKLVESSMEDSKGYVDDNNNIIIEVKTSKDHSYALEKIRINQSKNQVNEFLKKYPEIKLPTGIELEKAANIYHDLQEMEYRYVSEELKNGTSQKFLKMDKTIKEYFEACYHKHSIYEMEISIDEFEYLCNFHPIIPFMKEPSVTRYVNREKQIADNNFDSPLDDLVSKYQLALFIAGTQIIGEVCNDNVS